jgi:hypothetical protein
MRSRTGTRRTTLTQFPVAFCAGSSENSDPVAGAPLILLGQVIAVSALPPSRYSQATSLRALGFVAGNVLAPPLEEAPAPGLARLPRAHSRDLPGFCGPPSARDDHPGWCPWLSLAERFRDGMLDGLAATWAPPATHGKRKPAKMITFRHDIHPHPDRNRAEAVDGKPEEEACKPHNAGAP